MHFFRTSRRPLAAALAAALDPADASPLRRPHAAMLALLLLLATPCHALLGPLDILSLPPDIDLAISIDRGADASRLASGKAARQMSEEMAARLGLPAAWNELWKTLDLPPDEAVDKLLGRRVLVAWRWSTPEPAPADQRRTRRPPDPDWVVISIVSEQTERRLRERLRPAPRDIQDGQAILTLEDGRFLLTTRVLDRDAGRGRRGERSALLMLAPAAHVALFKDMLPRLAERAPGPTLGDDPRLADLRRLLEADIAVLTRARSPRAAQHDADQAADHDAAIPQPPPIMVLGAWWRRGEDVDARGPGLDARLVRLDASLPTDLPANSGLAPGQIDLLAGGALLALADVVPAAPEPPAPDDGPPRRAEVSATFPQGPTLGSIISTIAAQLGPAPGAGTLPIGPETVALLHGSGRPGDPLSLTLAVAARDLSLVAPGGDQLMCAVLTAPPDTTGAATSGPDFRGAYPPAVRTAAIPEGSPARLGGLLGESPTVAWQFAPMQGVTPSPAANSASAPPSPAPTPALTTAPAPAANSASAPPSPAPTPALTASPPPAALAPDADASPWAVPGWWVARLQQAPLTGGAPSRVRAVADILTSPHKARGIITAGILRPADMLGALAAVRVPIPPAMGAVRWIDRIRWEGALIAPGHLAVELSIDLNSGMGATPP